MAGDVYEELEEAKKEHIINKFWLKGLLDGFKKDKVDKLEDFPNCRLGQWLDSAASDRFKSWRGMEELKKLHVEFHVMVKMIVRLHESGMKKASMEKYRELDAISRRMTILLTELQRQVKRKEGSK